MTTEQHHNNPTYRWSRVIFLLYVVLIFPLLAVYFYLDAFIELSGRDRVMVMIPCTIILSINLLILLFQPRWITKLFE